MKIVKGYTFLKGFVHLADGLILLFTLGLYQPRLLDNYNLWVLKNKYK